MKNHRITFQTPAGKIKDYILILAETYEVAVTEFKNDFPNLEVVQKTYKNKLRL